MDTLSHLQLGWTTVRWYEIASYCSYSSVKLKTYQLLISGIFHTLFWPWLTMGNWNSTTRRQTQADNCTQNSHRSLLTLCLSLPPGLRFLVFPCSPLEHQWLWSQLFQTTLHVKVFTVTKPNRPPLSKQQSSSWCEVVTMTTFYFLRFSSNPFSSSAGLPSYSAVSWLDSLHSGLLLTLHISRW